jgi:hypothetical protein
MDRGHESAIACKIATYIAQCISPLQHFQPTCLKSGLYSILNPGIYRAIDAATSAGVKDKAVMLYTRYK